MSAAIAKCRRARGRRCVLRAAGVQPQQHRGGEPRERGRPGQGLERRRGHLEVRAGDEARSRQHAHLVEARRSRTRRRKTGRRCDRLHARPRRRRRRPTRRRSHAEYYFQQGYALEQLAEEGRRQLGRREGRPSRRPSSSTRTTARPTASSPEVLLHVGRRGRRHPELDQGDRDEARRHAVLRHPRRPRTRRG